MLSNLPSLSEVKRLTKSLNFTFTFTSKNATQEEPARLTSNLSDDSSEEGQQPPAANAQKFSQPLIEEDQQIPSGQRPPNTNESSDVYWG